MARYKITYKDGSTSEIIGGEDFCKEFTTKDLKGLEFNPILNKWKKSDNLSVNYIICSAKN